MTRRLTVPPGMACVALGTSPAKVLEMIESGELQATKDGSGRTAVYFIDARDVERLAADRLAGRVAKRKEPPEVRKPVPQVVAKDAPPADGKSIQVYCSHSLGRKALVGSRGKLTLCGNRAWFTPVGGEAISLIAATVEIGRVTIVLNDAEPKHRRHVSVFVRRPLPADPDRARRLLLETIAQRDEASPSRLTYDRESYLHDKDDE